MQVTTAADVLKHIQEVKIVAILRGDFSGMWEELGAALVEGGIEAMEVTLSCPNPVGAIRILREKCGSQCAIGAGTVMTPEQVDAVVAAGAQFIVAPNTNPKMIERCVARGVLAIPGAYTATEVEYAYSLGAGIIKLFPAGPVGPGYIKALRGPYPKIPIMATGGIEIEQIADFIKAGANAIGIGSPLVSSDTLQPGGFDIIRKKANKAVSALHHRVT